LRTSTRMEVPLVFVYVMRFEMNLQIMQNISQIEYVVSFFNWRLNRVLPVLSNMHMHIVSNVKSILLDKFLALFRIQFPK
jgi:hypothetical protein